MINIFVLSKLLGENYEKLVKSKKGKTFLKEYVNTIKNNRFLFLQKEDAENTKNASKSSFYLTSRTV